MKSYAFTKYDANHEPLCKRYREYNCSVVDLASVGQGCPDVAIGTAGVTDFVEFKTDDGQLTPEQETFHKYWNGSPIWIVRDFKDVDLHVASMRKRARYPR